MDYVSLRKRIVEVFPRLSPELQKAARFVLDRPDEVGLGTLRRTAELAGVQPATMVRFVRALGIDGYKTFQEPYAARLRGRSADYTARAKSLRERGGDDEVERLLGEIAAADADNLRGAFEANEPARLMAFCDALLAARRVYVLGLRGSFPVAFAFHYAYRFFRSNGLLLDGVGGTFADALRSLRAEDALLAIGFSPYTTGTVKAIDYARHKGAAVLAVTDSVVSPLAKGGDHVLFSPDESPSFYQSFVGPLALIQAVVSLLAARGGEEVFDDITESEQQLADFDAYWQTAPLRRRRRTER